MRSQIIQENIRVLRWGFLVFLVPGMFGWLIWGGSSVPPESGFSKNSRVGSKYYEIIRANTPLSSTRLKSAFIVGARALRGMGAARTTTCVRKEVASRMDLMINIWRGLSKRVMGWRPAWQSYCSWCHFIPEIEGHPVVTNLTCHVQLPVRLTPFSQPWNP